MGRPKQLLPYRGRTLLRHAAETAVASGCGPIVLVTGALNEALAAEVAGLPIQAVHNSDWETGMASSIRAGLAAVEAAQPRAVLIMLSDQPHLTRPGCSGNWFSASSKSEHPSQPPRMATRWACPLFSTNPCFPSCLRCRARPVPAASSPPTEPLWNRCLFRPACWMWIRPRNTRRY